MRAAVEGGVWALLSALYLYWLYQMTIAVRGFGTVAAPPPATRRSRFAVVVPARDEEQVIGPLLDSLRTQTYADDAYDVYVSCDRCTDATPDIARSRGARVLERSDGPEGKTANLGWALARIPLDPYDAVVVFDADNIVHPDFLTRMNDALAAFPDALAIQGYLDAKNPNDTWVTRVYALSFWYANRFWQLARDRAGLSVNLGGTGEALRVSALRRLGWEWTSLTDDLELTCEIALARGRVRYAPAAIAYDEKPLDLGTSRAQRARWLRGHYWALSRYGYRLMSLAVREHDRVALDLALHLAIPGRAAMSYATMFGGFLVPVARALLPARSTRSRVATSVSAAMVAAAFTQCALVLVVAPSIHERAITGRYVRDIASFFWYGARWLPTAFHVWLDRRDQSGWSRTPHSRQLAIEKSDR